VSIESLSLLVAVISGPNSYALASKKYPQSLTFFDIFHLHRRDRFHLRFCGVVPDRL
jgi:hypothetical protein